MLRWIRLPRRPLVAAAALAALLAVSHAPASAADQVELRFGVPPVFVMYRADEGARAVNGDFVLPVSVVRGGGGPARNVRVVVDTSGLKGVATASAGTGGNCTGDGPVYTCRYGDLQNGDGEATPAFTLHGVDGVAPGDSGTVTYTATADNAPSVTGTTRMTVGRPTLHAPDETEKVTGAAPGAPRRLTARFANRSRFPADRGVALRVDARDGLRLTSRPGNCWFASDSASAWCRFATKAAPGTAYATASPLTYTPAAGQLAGSLDYSWSSEPQRPEDLPERGTDAPLALERLTGTAARGLAGDTGRVDVETTAQADYTPVTATVRGRVGDTVRVRLGVRVLSTGQMASSEAMGGFRVVPPEGTTVTSIPYVFEGDESDWGCARPRKPGGAFDCRIGTDAFFDDRHQDGTTTIVFHLRIDRQVTGAQGSIRTDNPYDRTPGNDTAVIAVDASPAPLYRRLHLVPVTILAVAVAFGALLYRNRPSRRPRP
ncbi:hypothetical protein ACIPSE_24265 [Streptomyces sp. NPDC090106]|uniref:hypothetical protein n=1 Tax=Streptomyces sp. NPDC090106 TaxID=3365946 RepID=UPI003808ED3E